MFSRIKQSALAVMLVAIAPIVTTGLTAQQSASIPRDVRAAHDSSRMAWEAGDYIDALERWERMLLGSAGEQPALQKQIALITGEWHPAREIAPDGRAPRWSADGRLLAYTTGDGAAATRVVTVLDVSGTSARTVATLSGYSPAFSADGRTLYVIRVEENPALRTAARAVEVAADIQARRAATAEYQRAERAASRLVARTLGGSAERTIPLPDGLTPRSLAGASGGGVLVTAGDPVATASGVLLVVDGGGVRRVSESDAPVLRASSARGVTGWLSSAGSAGPVGGSQPPTLRVVHDDGRALLTQPASDFALSADGSAVVWASVGQDGVSVRLQRFASAGAAPMTVVSGARSVASLAISHDGSSVAFQMMPREDWEVFVWNVGDTAPARLTQEIQHDLFPRFVADGRLLAVMGEARHRRSYLYDPATGARERLFHNDLIRTVAPEYEWEVSPDGSRVAVVSERDGDTITPERALYLTDLRQTVSRDALVERVRNQLAAERDLRERGTAMFAPIADAVRRTVAEVSKDRIYEYADTLYRFGSKYIGTPGNLAAIEFLADRLRAFGYEPELQWFEPSAGVRTANVIARLPGTENEDLVYVASSHFDSVRGGPGADDNSSGSTALLEAARVMATRPQPATIEFAFFTGEEAGLLGSREYVRRAVADGKHIVGALNNDMIGYANDQRLDNTIRYSNEGLRDLQHAAAFLFTDLITYDAKYYKSTDAHAYYEAYGDIVAGIGSYPILGNPHYHQWHDVLETINQQLVAEVSKTTAASLMLMASSPSRLPGVTIARARSGIQLSWQPAVESGVAEYEVAYGPPEDPFATVRRVSGTSVRLTDAPAGAEVRVRAVAPGGLRGWDWQLAGADDGN